MKAEHTVPRIRANRDPRAPGYYVDLDAHRNAAGLLPVPLLARMGLAAGAAAGIVAIGFVGALLGWW